MSPFTVVRETPLSVAEAWAAVSDLRSHGEVVPLTRMVLDTGEPHVGWGFAAGTGAGPVTIWDHMIVTRWDPPRPERPAGAVHIVKTGQWLSGWAHIHIEAAGEGARVEWTEEISPALDPAPRLTAPAARRLGSKLFATTLNRLLARAEAAASV